MNLFLLSLVCVLLGELGSQPVSAMHHQLVGLRHPPQPRAVGPNPGQKPRFTAKPGDIVVHFDHNHEIQQLQYVLRDGRLINLYQRRHDQANSRAPVQVAPNQRSDLVGIEPTSNESDQSIEIIDSNNHEVSRLVGRDHITVELPDNKGGGQIQTLSTGVNSNSNNNQDSGIDLLLNDKMDILATVAVNGIQSGQNQFQEPKVRGSTIILEKLKSKVGQKLRELPHLIESKLRSKSSGGQVFLDQAGRKVVIVDDESNGELPSGEIPAASHQPIKLRQPSLSSIVSTSASAFSSSSQAPAPILAHTMQQMQSHTQQTQIQTQAAQQSSSAQSSSAAPSELSPHKLME